MKHSDAVPGTLVVPCSVEGCDRPKRIRGLCNAHHHKFLRYGDPLVTRRAPNGTGSLGEGYRKHWIDGGKKLAHRIEAEKVLGKPLPPGAIVHHVNQDRLDNRHENLVICPDTAYHRLLHQRMRAQAACGNANWRLCRYCKRYDDPAVMHAGRKEAYHRDCAAQYNRSHRGSRAAAK